jgi:hypothetical protein
LGNLGLLAPRTKKRRQALLEERWTVPSATAILDRFLHHAELIQITGRSDRLRDAGRGRTDSKPANAPSGSEASGTDPKPANAPPGSAKGRGGSKPANVPPRLGRGGASAARAVRSRYAGTVRSWRESTVVIDLSPPIEQEKA